MQVNLRARTTSGSGCSSEAIATSSTGIICSVVDMLYEGEKAAHRDTVCREAVLVGARPRRREAERDTQEERTEEGRETQDQSEATWIGTRPPSQPLNTPTTVDPEGGARGNDPAGREGKGELHAGASFCEGKS
jgi:hypothetical protein